MTAIAELEENRTVEGIYAVARKERLRTKKGGTYLALELVDPSGRIPARVWNDVDLLDGRFEAGDAVRVLGRVEKFRNELQVEVRTLEPADGVDPAELAVALRRDADELEGFLEFLVAEVHDDGLREVVVRALGEAPLRSYPATPDGHHSYAGGLLEHTVGVATLCRELCQIHPRLRPDLLIAAALVHDVGRTRSSARRRSLRRQSKGNSSATSTLVCACSRGSTRPTSSSTPSPATTTHVPHAPPRPPSCTTRTSSTPSPRQGQFPTENSTVIAIVLALAASLSWGLADFGGGLGARRTHLVWVLVVSQLAGLALVGVMYLATRPQPPTETECAWGIFAGVMGVVGLSAFYRALAVGTMGIVGPISATGAIVPVVYGLARGERPAAIQAVGIVIAVVGVVAASLEPLPEGAGRKLATGVGFALIAALGFGSSLLGLNRVSQAGVVWGTLTLRLTVVPIVLIAALVVRPSAAKLRPVVPLLVATGLFDTGANLLYGASARHGLISVTAVLASLYPVVLVALAYFVLHERISRPQLAGVALALTGVALISAGG